MAPHNLLEPRVLELLSAARQRYGDVIIERVPSVLDVSTFLKQLHAHTAPQSVADRFHFSERDATVAFSNVVHNPPAALAAQFPGREVMVRLFTVSQDYTNRSSGAWSGASGWDQRLCARTLQPQHVREVNELLQLDAAQKFLLGYQNRTRYLHVVRRDLLTENKRDLVLYTVEVADRLATEPTVNMPSLQSLVNSWPSQHDFTRRRAHPHEVTLWAVLNMVPAQAQYDLARLHIIRDAINAVAPFCEPPPSPLSAAPRTLHAGNMYFLLRVRHSKYQDGRARYAVASAMVNNRALAPLATPPVAPPPSATAATGTGTGTGGGSGARTEPVVRTTRDNRLRIVLIALLTLLTGALGLIYLVRLRHVGDDGVDDVVGVALAIVFGIMVPSAAVWIWLCYGCRSRADAVAPRVELDAQQLYRATEHGSAAERVQAACSTASRAHYNDDRLTFTALSYSGTAQYPGSFSVSQLLAAGYRSTFALDGREVLVTPNGAWVRLLALDRDGGAVFDNGVNGARSIETRGLRAGEQFAQRVVPQTYGEWTADLQIGSRALLRDGVHSV